MRPNDELVDDMTYAGTRPRAAADVRLRAGSPHVGTATTRGLPDPGGSVPRISWPTVSLFFAALAVFAFSSWAAIEHRLPWALTVAANALAIFVMFTVLHDAAHRSLSTIGWVNATLGRAAMVFVSPAMAFPAWSFIHLEHHRWANDPAHDPDSFASSTTGWQTPLRWLFMDGPYVAFYTRHRKGRPRARSSRPRCSWSSPSASSSRRP